MLQRISSQDPESSASTAGTDAARRSDARRGNEAETRERAARFRSALGKRDAESAEGRLDLHAQRGQERQQERLEDRGRDRAAAAEVLGRLGLEQERLEDGRAPGGNTGPAATGKGEQAGDLQGATAQAGSTGAADPTKLKDPGLAEAAGTETAPAELGPEMKAIEDAIQKVLQGSEKADAGSDTAATPPADAFAVPGPTPWARPEGPARPEAPRQLPSPPPGPEAYHRLLMGQGPAGAEARLNITQGPLAGLQIHLTHGPGGVQAAVLTQGASSRQTLVSAMDQVAQRLRQKGHNLDLRFGAAGAQRGAGSTPRRG